MNSQNYYIHIPSASQISKCSNKIVAYIAGFIVHSLGKVLQCETCVDALTLSHATASPSTPLSISKAEGD